MHNGVAAVPLRWRSYCECSVKRELETLTIGWRWARYTLLSRRALRVREAKRASVQVRHFLRS
jgi:hypothetical protein